MYNELNRLASHILLVESRVYDEHLPLDTIHYPPQGSSSNDWTYATSPCPPKVDFQRVALPSRRSISVACPGSSRGAICRSVAAITFKGQSAHELVPWGIVVRVRPGVSAFVPSEDDLLATLQANFSVQHDPQATLHATLSAQGDRLASF
jgi:hypothetical protein